jgi:hypothetical protein
MHRVGEPKGLGPGASPGWPVPARPIGSAKKPPLVRGTLLRNTMGFLRETYGPGAHASVLRALPHDLAAVFRLPVREASWEPLDALVAYIETAKRTFAPDDPDFYRRMGSYAGRSDREARAMGVMVRDLDTATKMAGVLWRSFFSEGRLEVAERTPGGAVLRILDFPAHRALCERIAGSLEGLLGGAAAKLSVAKDSCLLDGDPCCEYRLEWR